MLSLLSRPMLVVRLPRQRGRSLIHVLLLGRSFLEDEIDYYKYNSTTLDASSSSLVVVWMFLVETVAAVPS
jgi:hypothetical protein